MNLQRLTSKFSWTVLGVVVLFLAGINVYAEEFKLGYINSIKIRAEYKEFADAQAKFDKEIAEFQNQDVTYRQEIDSLQKILESQALLLSEAKRKEKEQQLDTKKQAYRKFFDEVFGPDGKVEKKNAELTKPILDKINAALEKIANQDGYAFIFDAVNGNVAYAKKTFDITDKVLAELNK
ncbi:MAG: OmpH family outer membrane protein [candidate division Zixibacteria bacterium]|nr:OmpH family outer membrane protein [candidate division Zixibacteria bacterium]